MCTVSFVFSNGKAILTHNRDEKVARPSAIEPQKYTVNNKNIYFPKDQKAGGTWYAVAENGAVLVLLNGADEKHQLKPSYRKSRGLIVLDLISSNSPIEAWNSIDLTDIEPFTIVLFQDKKLYQLRWNEVEKTTLDLDVNQPHIWSSSTLYPKEIRDHRAEIFQNFIISNDVSAEKLFHFHRYAKEDDQENGLIINRNNEMKTLSITQTIIQENKIVLSYHDLQNQEEFTNSITIQ
ncbi:NRDE family protein [Flavobacterium sp.]|uniref:NRDE family protein n=1 Tax=Flavobacterium sp. TaxID=239 RepID=UPI00260293D6|nr:NRDE family protein [Flavobacterium sp.]